MGAFVLHAVESLLVLAVFVQLTKTAKFGGFAVDPALARGELAWLALPAAAVALTGALGAVALGGALALGLVVAAAALWLDAVLFRVFTIELGPGGVRDVVVSVLYRELSELAHARRFFAAHRGFALAPAAVALGLGDAALGLPDAAHRAVLAAVALALGAAALGAAGRGAWRARALTALLAALAAAGELWTEGAAARVMVAAAATALLALLAKRPASGEATPAGVAHFFNARRYTDDPAFVPRAEHARIVAAAPRVPPPSALHGRLRGADVVLLTFESVGRDHLAAYAPGGAASPLFDALAQRGTASAHHVCVCPTTNNAHVALYTGGYDPAARGGFVAALRRAGMRTAYLTAARTRDYGLSALLERAGFSAVFDRDTLGGEVASDYDLLGRGLDRLARFCASDRAAPLFLHVHATHTHVPYRVVDGARFARFDAREDAGRFRNGIEETDHVFARLLGELAARGVVRDPLVIVTSDHGQAFGAMGYHSHGSAVIADELLVPFALAHPALPPARVHASSHFDVMPTVLDLLGVPAGEPCHGASVFAERDAANEPALLVWAGHPSRTSTTNCGVVLPGEKLMLDLVLDRCHRMDWNDRHATELRGADKAYVAALLGRLMALRGVR